MQTLVDDLSLRVPSSSVKLNSKVSALRQVAPAGGWVVDFDSGASLHADAVCVTVPTHVAASLLRESTPTLSEELASIAYASTATVNLAYKRADIPHSLDGFGFVVPFIEKRSLIACTFSSIKFAGRAPDGYVLLRAFIGGALQPEMFALDEADMLRRVQLDLRELLGVEKAPLFCEVTRWPRSMPQYEIGHLERLQRMDDNLALVPTLKLAGNAYRGAGIPDCIKSGENGADEMVTFFETMEGTKQKPDSRAQ
jgi:oxygen-dependent protoporphyrinogen oxidase